MIEVVSAEQPEMRSPQEIRERLIEILNSMKDALATVGRAAELLHEMNDEVSEAQQELQSMLHEITAAGAHAESSVEYQDQLETLAALIGSRDDMKRIIEEETVRARELEAVFGDLHDQLSSASQPRLLS